VASGMGEAVGFSADPSPANTDGIPTIPDRRNLQPPG
jgi:hypothetical protein